MRTLLLGAAALAVLATSANAYADAREEAPSGPSFNCAYAKAPDEVLICQRPDLAALDRELAALYSRLVRQEDEHEIRLVRFSQGLWLKRRHACGYNHDCIQAEYEQRIDILSE